MDAATCCAPRAQRCHHRAAGGGRRSRPGGWELPHSRLAERRDQPEHHHSMPTCTRPTPRRRSARRSSSGTAQPAARALSRQAGLPRAEDLRSHYRERPAIASGRPSRAAGHRERPEGAGSSAAHRPPWRIGQLRPSHPDVLIWAAAAGRKTGFMPAQVRRSACRPAADPGWLEHLAGFGYGTLLLYSLSDNRMCVLNLYSYLRLSYGDSNPGPLACHGKCGSSTAAGCQQETVRAAQATK